MKVLVLGCNGFIGSEVMRALQGRHEVYGASYAAVEDGRLFVIDLRDKGSISRVLGIVRPEAVLNCAGIVGGAESDLNVTFTTNLMEVIVDLQLHPKRVIVTGSAAEYGAFQSDELPVRETTPLRAESGYGHSKIREVAAALSWGKRHHTSVVVARLFNPIGPGMAPKFLIPALLRQIEAIRSGQSHTIEISRLDSERDYVDVRDVARAYVALLEGEPHHDVYNVGSGRSVSNGDVLEYLLRASELSEHPEIVETVSEREPQAATRADITRLRSEFGWEPQVSIKDSIENIIRHSR